MAKAIVKVEHKNKHEYRIWNELRRNSKSIIEDVSKIPNWDSLSKKISKQIDIINLKSDTPLCYPIGRPNRQRKNGKNCAYILTGKDVVIVETKKKKESVFKLFKNPF
jgi:hypothetical protein